MNPGIPFEPRPLAPRVDLRPPHRYLDRSLERDVHLDVRQQLTVPQGLPSGTRDPFPAPGECLNLCKQAILEPRAKSLLDPAVHDCRFEGQTDHDAIGRRVLPKARSERGEWPARPD